MTRALAVLLLLLAPGCPTAEEPWHDPGTSEQFLGYDVLPELDLQIDADGLASLERAPREWVPAHLGFAGDTFGPVGVRLKGQSSFRPITDKAAFRIKIDKFVEGATFYGLKDLTLNNLTGDPSMMHERLAYLVARAAGLPASRANHALVTVNGEPYGLYANVETVKPRMLRTFFDDHDGPLFEATDVDFEAQYVASYELESGPDDRRLIEGLVAALTREPADAALADADRFLAIDHFQTFWATSSVIGQFDAFPFSVPGDDYFLYADPDSDRLWLIPWGMDETFSAADFSPQTVSSVLALRCKASAACFQGYVDLTWSILEMTEELGLDAERARVEAQIAPHVAADPRRPYDDAEVAEAQRQLGYFIRDRRIWLGRFLPPPSG